MTQKKDRILVVDDEPAIRDVLHDILELEGYDVVAAESAATALRLLRQGSFDLLLTDIMLPGMSGLDLVRRVREMSPRTASILVTGHPSLETVEAAMPQGIRNYIVKPFNKNELCKAVASACASSGGVDDQGAARAGPFPNLSQGPAGRPAAATAVEAAFCSAGQDGIQALRDSQLFDTLSDRELYKIASICRKQTYEAGETICKTGERALELHVVRHGSVVLVTNGGDPEAGASRTTRVDPGGIIGWAVLIGTRVNTMSAVSLTTTEVLAVDGAELRYVLDKEPHAGYEVFKRLAALLDARLTAGNGAREPQAVAT